MAMQVHACCKSVSTAPWTRGPSAKSSADGSPTISSSCSCLPLSKSGWPLGERRECVVGEGRRTRVGKKRGAVVGRASSGGPSGKDESKAVYDAFFLGKALAESISERVVSAVGEFLSDVGRRQAEQQKQIREFQDEVQERAAAAALKAAQKALATEKEEKIRTPTSPPPPSPSPKQPPPSTSGLSNLDEPSTGILDVE